MKRLFVSEKAKIAVDILMAAGFVTAGFCVDAEVLPDVWTSAHCITGAVWFLMIIVHVAQHWRMIKSLTRKEVILKNRITALTLLSFILMFVSILSFAVGINIPLLKYFHQFAGRFFMLMFITHTIHKWKRFLALFGRKQVVGRTEPSHRAD
jgi:hypothetical protein